MSAKQIPNALRDGAITEFRKHICERYDIVPLVHQAKWFAATDGGVMLDVEDETGVLVLLPDEVTPSPSLLTKEINGHYYPLSRRVVIPRLHGRARVIGDLGSFKIGKSFGAGLFAASFACVPGGRVSLVGSEYDICEPEFDYIVEFLLSDRGMAMKYDSLQNRPREGKMWLDLPNGMRYEAKSWERKDSLKGKEIDCYVYCLPLDAPVWMGDYSFRPLVDVHVGDIVISGHPKGQLLGRQRLQRTTVTATHRTRKEVFCITLESGRKVYGTADHKWMNGADGDTAARNRYVLPTVGRTLAHVIDDPGPAVDTGVAQWLAGMYDGEGCRTLIAQDTQHNARLYRELSTRMQQLGFSVTELPEGVRWLGGRQAAVKFVNQIPSFRYRWQYADKAILGCRFKDADKITAIEPCGVHDVGCLTTETGNFIAYGYQTSNCEAYQLPGMECYTDFSQNLRARQGYAVLPTTPDRPWVKELHEHGHTQDPGFEDWCCVCDIPGSANPYTFDAGQKARDRSLMTAEKYAIHHEGKLGQFVGSVYHYQRGERLFTPVSHPHLFREGAGSEGPLTLGDLVIPSGWAVLAGADTGTFYSAVVVMFSPGGDAFVFAEFPNYRYVGGSIELLNSTTAPSWAEGLGAFLVQCGGRAQAWADLNSQFKKEMLMYGLHLLGNTVPIEKRTDTAREYFQHGLVFLAPWLSILPFELENAKWPEEATSAGAFRRIKDRDHTLDCLEHILSRRPKGVEISDAKPKRTWAESFGLKLRQGGKNPHMGTQ